MIDRKLYNQHFKRDNLPSWRCPKCNSSVLKIQDDKFLAMPDSLTQLLQNNDEFDWVSDCTYTFTALLLCTNLKCKEIVACSGTGYVEYEYFIDNGRQERTLVDYFKPYFFYPALNIFLIPEKTPEDVKNSIRSSFSLLFTNKSAAANQIRIALEYLLTALKIKRFNIKPGERRRLNLHQRIELLPKKYQEVQDICLAIKWLGNSGSHNDEKLSFDNIFDGYDMLSFILNKFYDNQERHVKRLAKNINVKKGV